MSEKKRKRSRLKNWIWNSILILALGCFVLSGYMVFTKINNPDADLGDFFGYTIAIVKTDSMVPTIVPGAMTIGQKVDFSAVQTGDIIAYSLPDGQLNTHRVIGVSENYIYTKGDNLAAPDGLNIDRETYQYKVVNIINEMAELKTTDGIIKYLVIPGAILVLLIILIVVVVSALKKRRRRKQALWSNDEDESEIEHVDQSQVMYAMPVQQFEQIQPVQQFEQVQPVQQFEQVQPVQQFEQVQPVQQFEQVQPVQQFEQVQPVQRFEQVQPVQQFEQVQPVQQFEQVQPQVMQQERVMYQQEAQPNSIASLMEQLPQQAQQMQQQQVQPIQQFQQPIQQASEPNWRDEIFKDVDFGDIDLSDISLDDLDDFNF